MLCTEIFSDAQNNFGTQHVLPMFCKKKSFWQRFTCTVHEDFNENDFKEHFCPEIKEIEKQPTIDSNSPESESINPLSERSVHSNENQNTQQESNSIQIPVRKNLPVRQSRVDIVYEIQERGSLEKGTLEKGILFGCKICFPHRVFTNFKDLYEHFKNYKEFFTHYTL